jgi:hypothetical protein
MLLLTLNGGKDSVADSLLSLCSSQAICGKCTVQKKLLLDSSEDATLRQFAFCLPCVIDANKSSAWDVALAGVVAGSP